VRRLSFFKRCPLRLLIASVPLLTSVPGIAQTVMNGNGGPVRLFGTDQAVFEMREPRQDLPCHVTPTKSALVGFDLKFHSGFEVTVPLRELAGRENLLTILFRVAPLEDLENPVYFMQKVRVPEIEEDAKGDASLYGAFDLGEGKYRVDWLMRDRAERVCSNYWDVEATLNGKESQMAMVIPAKSVRAADQESFKDEPPIERAAAEEAVNVKVLLNYAPQNPRNTVMRPVDTTALISILRSILREPKIGKFSLVAFSMANQQVLYRQENVDHLDLPALGEALSKVKFGTVDLSKLAVKHSETQFLGELIRTELGGANKSEAIIFAGPKVMLEQNVEAETLKEVGAVDFPLFYLNYNLYPAQIPWRDSISHAVKFFKGQEYTISKPRDLWYATSEVVNRIVKNRSARLAQNSPSQ
jgi:hypothetical protein